MATKYDQAMLVGSPEKLSLTHLKTTDWIVAIIVGYIIWTVYDVYFGPLAKFPGPKLWAASRFPLMRAMWNGNEIKPLQKFHETYGPVVRISPVRLSYTDPAAWKDIYGHRSGGKSKTFEKDRDLYVRDAYIPDTILIADDANHTRQRRILANSFSDKALRQQEPLLKRWANLMISKLSEVETSGNPCDMVGYYNFTTFDIMADLTFAEPMHMLEKSEYVPWVKTIFDSTKVAGKLGAIKHLPYISTLQQYCFPASIARSVREHQQYSYERVDRRLARDPGRPDLWTEVLKRSGTDDDPTAKMSLGEMHVNSRLLMTAGTETTATLLSGLTYHLLCNRDKLAKLVDEVRGTFKIEEDISVDTLATMPYLNACLEEGLRMYPPVPVGLPRHVPAGGAAILGSWIPEKTVVWVHQYCVTHSSANFLHPHTFAPERWLGDPVYASDKRSASQPFSTGPRNCIGKNLANHEMRLLLAMVLWNFDLILETESANWADQKVFLLWEKLPLMVRLKRVR